jgi:hypothetical protein
LTADFIRIAIQAVRHTLFTKPLIDIEPFITLSARFGIYAILTITLTRKAYSLCGLFKVSLRAGCKALNRIWLHKSSIGTFLAIRTICAHHTIGETRKTLQCDLISVEIRRANFQAGRVSRKEQITTGAGGALTRAHTNITTISTILA